MSQFKESKRRWPSLKQWIQIGKVLTEKEKLILVIFLVLFLGSLSVLGSSFYYKNTEIKPADGGTYQEGLIGQPRFINPIYGAANDVDRDLIELLFSGLMKYDSQGKLIPDLAREYKIQEEGKVYEFYLKENAVFHDNKKISAQDIIFTIETIQNSDFKSPLRTNWLGVKVEKISEDAVRFKLKNPYPAFLERLTQKILPSHLWQDISPQNFPLAPYNFQPIGSGPYQFKNLEQDNSGKILSLSLEKFSDYYGKKPYLSQVSFSFFDKEEELIKAEQTKEIQGYSPSLPENCSPDKNQNIALCSFSLPRYFAVFFNPDKNEFLAEKEVRQALNYGTDKEEILKNALLNKAEIIDSPILPKIYQYNPPSMTYEFNPEEAKSLFKKAGFEKRDDKLVKVTKEESAYFTANLEHGSKGEDVTKLQECLSSLLAADGTKIYPEGTISGYFGSKTEKAVIKFQEEYSEKILSPAGLAKGTGKVRQMTRAVLDEVCIESNEEILDFKLSLVTVEDSTLKKVAEILKTQWEKLGIKVEIETFPISSLKQEVIKTRDYQVLLFGEALGTIPDPFPFWHSSQIRDPGLNLSKYENEDADELLENARTALDTEIQTQKYQDFQDILIEDAPAIFLYSPNYIYLVSNKIKGICPVSEEFSSEAKAGIIADPSKRFSNIENWYIKTKRVWKK